MCDRYIHDMLTWFRLFQDKLLYLFVFSLSDPSHFREKRDKNEKLEKFAILYVSVC